MIRAGRWVVLAAALAGCGGDGAGPGETAVATVNVSSGGVTSILVGGTVQLVASALDAQARPVTGRTVSWSSGSAAVASVSSSGLVTGVTPGSAQISATVDGKSGSVQITVNPLPVASVTVTPNPGAVAVSSTLQLNAELRSGTGAVLTGRTVTWQTSDASKATVSGSGLVTGVADGVATITATSEGVSGTASVVVGNPPAPVISAITPALLRPGVQAVITATNLSPNTSGNTVTIGGVPVVVTSVSGAQLSVQLPQSGFTCKPTHDAEVKITVGGLSGTRGHPLQVATDLSLVAGDHRLLLDPVVARCNELAAGGGRYMIAVVNSNRPLGSTISFTLSSGASAAEAGVTSSLAPSVRPVMRAWPETPIERSLRRTRELHVEMLEQMRVATSRLRVRQRPAAEARASASLAAAAGVEDINQTPGALSKIAIPDFQRWQSTQGAFLCAYPDSLVARTVYAGQKVLVLEDTTSLLKGQMDDILTDLGQIYDAAQHNVVSTNFGDPLAIDNIVNQDLFRGPEIPGVGKVVMVFTPKMFIRLGNNTLGGSVSICDFLNAGWFAPPDDTLFKATNKAAVFFATPPSSADRGLSGTFGNRDWFHYVMPTVIVHEAKHISSFANHVLGAFATGQLSFEETWLEEGTAMHAEEIWARTMNQATLRGNATYANTLYCDFVAHRDLSPCNGRPLTMFDHWVRLYRHMAAVETRTIFGDPGAGAGSGTFYGSAWMFVRWLIDHSAGDDAAFLGALNRDAVLSGVTNIEVRAGRPFAQLLAEWNLALALDDRNGFNPANPRLTVPSWNLVDVFGGAFSDQTTGSNLFALEYPLVPRPITYPAFSETRTVTAGSASFFELSGTHAGRQVIELAGPGGVNAPSGLGIAIARIQ